TFFNDLFRFHAHALRKEPLVHNQGCSVLDISCLTHQGTLGSRCNSWKWDLSAEIKYGEEQTELADLYGEGADPWGC
ncbi:hypothetical protein A2U01_0014163, partial [Trifolium medium]|nr:hypothetical protein [Trifolium medium]